MTGKRLLALLAVAALTTPACGARWTDEQSAVVLARDQSVLTSEQPAGPSDDPAADDGSVVTTTTRQVEGASSGVDAGGPNVEAGSATTGPTDGTATPGALPCSAASDAPGVGDNTITVGSISTLSGLVPGLGASAAGAVRAYVAFRNSTGGVCGRQIQLIEGDDGSDNGRYRTHLEDMEPKVLGLVGGFAIGDVGSVEAIRQHALPVVNNPSGEELTALPTLFDLNPPFESPNIEIGKYRHLRSQGARRVAFAYLAVDQSRAEANLQQQLMRAAGLEIVDVNELPVTTLSYDAAARRARSSGADYFFFIGDANANASMARSMRGTDDQIRFAEYFTFAYQNNFIEGAGESAEGAMTWLRSLPNSEAGANAELSTFLEWMGRAAPGAVPDTFANDSWASAKAFFDSLGALSGPITREALVAQLAATGTYDAGGMFGPIRLGEELTNGCLIGMHVRDGEWQRLAPADGFLC